MTGTTTPNAQTTPPHTGGGRPPMMTLPPKFQFYPFYLLRYQGKGSYHPGKGLLIVGASLFAAWAISTAIRSNFRKKDLDATNTGSEEWQKATAEYRIKTLADPISGHKIGTVIPDPYEQAKAFKPEEEDE